MVRSLRPFVFIVMSWIGLVLSLVLPLLTGIHRTAKTTKQSDNNEEESLSAEIIAIASSPTIEVHMDFNVGFSSIY